MSPYQHGEVYRHRRRGRDRPRPRPLRAFHRRFVAPVGQHHHGPHLPRHHRQGAARRLSRRDRPGDPARHQRDQGIRARRHRRAAISSSARSAAPSATSRACRSSKRSGSCGTTSAATRRSASTPRWCRGSPPRASSRPSRRSSRCASCRASASSPKCCCAAATGRCPKASARRSPCSATCPKSAVIPALDARNIYDVPLQYHEAGLDDEVLRAFRHRRRAAPDLARWNEIMDRIDHYESEVTIGVVGKYVGLPDAYKSLREALVHGGIANRAKVNIRVDRRRAVRASRGRHRRRARAAPRDPRPRRLRRARQRGQDRQRSSSPASAKSPSSASAWACRWPASRRRGTWPGIEEASTTEFGETSEPVVGMITEWMSEEGLQKRAAGGDLGGTMRLGAYPAKLDGNSVVRSIYGGRRDQRAPPPSLRGQRPLPRRAREGRAWSFPACRPTASCPRSSSGPTIRGSSASSSIPSSRAGPFEPHPLFAGFIEAAVKQSRLV